MALVITPSQGQTGNSKNKVPTRDRKKAREHYAFALSDPPPVNDPQDDPQKAAVVVTVSDEGHQKIAEAIDKKINDALDAMSTTEYLSGRSPLLK